MMPQHRAISEERRDQYRVVTDHSFSSDCAGSRACSSLQEKWSHPETMSHVCAGSVENGASIDLKALIYLPRQAKPSLWRISTADHGLSHLQCSQRTRTLG